jgi:hypothetical protein
VVYAEDRIDRMAGAPHPHPPEPPAVPLGLAEQQAIASFGERAAGLSADRVQELADLLEPITSQKGPAAVGRLLGIAAFITGGR